MPRYPIVTLTTDEELVNRRVVDVEALGEQLVPIRDVFLKLFTGTSSRGRGELHRLELGLTLTTDGNIAFATGSTKPSLTLTLERRQYSSKTRSASRVGADSKPDVVEII